MLDGFPVSMSEFFTPEEPTPRPQLFYSQAELPDVGAKDIAYFLVGAKYRNRSLCMLHEHYAVGADTGEDMIYHVGEEAGVVISGVIEITVGDLVETLGPGDAYYFDTSVPHRMRNVGGVPCVVVSAGTPPTY